MFFSLLVVKGIHHYWKYIFFIFTWGLDQMEALGRCLLRNVGKLGQIARETGQELVSPRCEAMTSKNRDTKLVFFFGSDISRFDGEFRTLWEDSWQVPCLFKYCQCGRLSKEAKPLRSTKGGVSFSFLALSFHAPIFQRLYLNPFFGRLVSFKKRGSGHFYMFAGRLV